MLHNGEVSLQSGSGKIIPIMLDTHPGDDKVQEMHSEDLNTCLDKCLKLRRFKEAWSYCAALNSKESWAMLGKAALRNLEINTGGK